MRVEELESIDKQIPSAMPLGTFAILFPVGRAVCGTRKYVVGLEVLRRYLESNGLSLG